MGDGDSSFDALNTPGKYVLPNSQGIYILMAPLRVLIITFTITLPPFHLFSFQSSWIFLFLFTFLVFYWNRRFKVIFNSLVAWGFSIFLSMSLFQFHLRIPNPFSHFYNHWKKCWEDLMAVFEFGPLSPCTMLIGVML